MVHSTARRTSMSEIVEGKTKTAIEGKRGTTFFQDPWRVTIVGRDKADVYTERHPLFQLRARRGVNVPRCLNMIRDGFPGIAKVCPGAGPGAPTNPTGGGSKDDLLVVMGRGRTIDARHANTIIQEAIKLRQTEDYETAEQLGKKLERVAGFEIPIAVARYLAAKGEHAPLLMVEVKVVRGDGGHLRSLAGAENAESMRDPDDDLYEHAVAIRAFLDEGQNFGVDESDAAVRWGVTTDTIRNRLKLLDCSADVIAQARAKTITWSDALNMAGLPDDIQQQRLEVIPKKTPGQKRRGRRDKARRPGKRIAERITEFLGPGHDVSRFWAFMQGVPGGVEGVLKIDKALKEIVAPEPKAKAPKEPRKAKKGTKK